jgi:hypothetical protein
MAPAFNKLKDNMQSVYKTEEHIARVKQSKELGIELNERTIAALKIFFTNSVKFPLSGFNIHWRSNIIISCISFSARATCLLSKINNFKYR